MKWNLLPSGWFFVCLCECVRVCVGVCLCLFVWPAERMSKRGCILCRRAAFPCAGVQLRGCVLCVRAGVIVWPVEYKVRGCFLHVGRRLLHVCTSYLRALCVSAVVRVRLRAHPVQRERVGSSDT